MKMAPAMGSLKRKGPFVQDVQDQPRKSKSTSVPRDQDQKSWGVDEPRTQPRVRTRGYSWIERTTKKLGGLVAYSVTRHRNAAK